MSMAVGLEEKTFYAKKFQAEIQLSIQFYFPFVLFLKVNLFKGVFMMFPLIVISLYFTDDQR